MLMEQDVVQIEEFVASCIVQRFSMAQKCAGETANMIPCPRCGRYTMRADLYQNATSRRADVMICPECGTEEAIEDYSGERMPLNDWAIVMGYERSNPNAKKV